MDILPNKTEEISIQQALFETIRARYPSNKSLVGEIAELLDISTDSAYRRMRGEKEMTLTEFQKLACHFNISLDKIIHINSGNYLFSDPAITIHAKNFNEQLEVYFGDLAQLKQSASAEIYFFTRDISIFCFYQFPELLAFKYFYWMKSVFNHPEYQKLKFSIDTELKKYPGKGVEAAKNYTEIDSIEIWSLENFNQILHQVRYLKELQLFADKTEPEKLYQALFEMINHIEAQADAGKKFLFKSMPDEKSGRFSLYINEFMHGGNNILVRSNDYWVSYVNHSIMNYLRTDDAVFCSNVKNRILEVIKKSDLISGTGEKQRRQFFNRLRDRVKKSRDSD